MRYRDDEDFIDLARQPRGRRPRRRWTGTVGQRGRAAAGLPQAVFKITSYNHSPGAVWDRLQYITREGELEAEGPNGERLDGELVDQVVGGWDRETEEGKGRRVAMSALVSFPKGADEERATEAARQFFAEAFADNHDYVFAGHRDTDYYHVHIVVQAAGHDGKQLRIGRDDLQDLRMRFAEKAAEQGIELDASPRWARGEEKARAPSPAVEGIMRRFRQPELELAGALLLSATRRTQLEALVEVRRDRDQETGVSAVEYARAAELVAGKMGAAAQEEKGVLAEAAVGLARRGLQLTSSSRGGEDSTAAEAAAVENVARRVARAVGAEIPAAEDDPAARRAVLTARSGLAAQLAAIRPQGARRWSKEAARPEPWAACQAVEYAREAGRVAMQLPTLATDHDRVEAVQGAVALARFGWELAGKEQGAAEERAHAREIIDKTERALRFAINDIADPQGKRAAIQARQRLYKAGVQEYRAARREADRQRRRAAERDEGLER